MDRNPNDVTVLKYLEYLCDEARLRDYNVDQGSMLDFIHRLVEEIEELRSELREEMVGRE